MKFNENGFAKRIRRAGMAIPAALALALIAAPAASATEYVVFLDDAASTTTVARSVGASVELEFSQVANGFTADLTDSQARRLDADPRVIDIHADAPFALGEFGTEDYESGALGIEAFKRGDFDDAAFKRGTLSEDAFKRGAFKRGTFDANAFKRGAFKRGAFKRGAFKRGAFKRGAIGSPFVSQWTPTGVDRIGARDWANNVNADIAVLDSGVDRHPDLNVAYATSCVPGEGPGDDSGHGTMVAGLAAAKDNRYGIVGAAPGARIWSVKVSDSSGTIMESAALCGLEFVLNNSKSLEVANLSWSGQADTTGASCDTLVAPSPQRTTAWRRLSSNRRGRWPWRRYDASVTPANPQPAAGNPGDEVDPASIDVLHGVLCGIEDEGVTVVAAAGNDASDASSVLPAAWPEVIAVSSFSDTDGTAGGNGPDGCITGDADDTFSSFSNFGSVIDVAAPGECLLSTDVDGNYSFGSGTSFATPLATGVAAVLAARDRNATPATIRAKILAAAEAGPITGDPDEFGEGVLRAPRM